MQDCEWKVCQLLGLGMCCWCRLTSSQAGGDSSRNHSHFEPLHSIDFVPPNINMSNKRVQMLVFEGNMAVIQVNRSPNVRHVQEHALC